MAESNTVNHFRVPKSGEEESKLLKESVPKSTVSVVFLICIDHTTHESRYPIQGLSIKGHLSRVTRTQSPTIIMPPSLIKFE